MSDWQQHGVWGKHNIQQQKGDCDLKKILFLLCGEEPLQGREGRGWRWWVCCNTTQRSRALVWLLLKCIPNLPQSRIQLQTHDQKVGGKAAFRGFWLAVKGRQVLKIIQSYLNVVSAN